MYQFAIVGCGHISGRHAENIQKVGRLKAVCDVVHEKANGLAAEYNSTPYYSLDELLHEETEIDIVVICTPNGYHAEHTIKSLKAGKHVLCEKPMCLRSSEALQMTQAAQAFKKMLFVVKQNRYNEPVTIVKKLLEQGTLGKILSFQINCFWNRPQQYYGGGWKGTKDLDGGILYTQFSHFIDLLYWFLGEVNVVRGFKKNNQLRSHFSIEDNGVAVLEMKSGAVGSINYTINAQPKNLEGSLSLFGEKGTIKIGGQYLNKLEWFEVAGVEKPMLIQKTSPNDYGFYQGSMSNHDKVYADLIQSINGNGGLLQAKDAIRTIEIIEKIYAATAD